MVNRIFTIARDFRRLEAEYTAPGYQIVQSQDVCPEDKALGAAVLDCETEFGDVNVAYVLAFYIATENGSLEIDSMSYKFDEEADAFLRILTTINANHDYMNDKYIDRDFAEHHQPELVALSSAPNAFRNGFWAVFYGDHALRKYESPSYKGSRDLEFYPGFTPYTVSNLEKTIEFSNRCLSVRKKSYFNQEEYQQTMKLCQ